MTEKKPTYEELEERVKQLENSLSVAINNNLLKQAEETIAKSNKLLSDMMDNSSSYIYMLDTEGHFISLNKQLANLFGKPLNEIIGQKRETVLPKEIAANHYANDLKVIEKRTTISFEEENIEADGKHTYFTIKFPLIDGHDNLYGVCGISSDITKKKQTEQELKTAKEKAEINEIELRKVQEITHIGSWYLDIATNKVTWSEELYKMYGFDPSKPVPPYTEHMKLFTSESWEILSTSLAKTREAGIPYELELKTIRNDQTNGWMWVRGEAIFDKDGKIVGLWGAAQDITERKHIEIELIKAKEIAEENEKKYRLQFMNMSSYNSMYEVLTDPDGKPYDFRFIMVNHAYEEYVGKKASELIGKTLLEVYPGTEQYWIDKMAEAYISGKPSFFENYSCVMKTNTEINLYVPQPGQLVMTTANIRQRKEAEENLRRSEAFKNAMVSNIGAVIVIIDKNGINQYKSPNILKLFGWQPEELIGKSTWNNIHPDDLEAGQEFFEKVLIEPNAKGTTELRYKRKDGNYVWIEISVINLLHDSDIQGILGNYHDISERKKNQEEIIAAKEKVEESERKLKAALESMTDAVFISDTEGNFIDFNEAFATFHKFKNKHDCAKTLKEYPLFLDVYLPSGELARLEQWAVPSALRGEIGIGKEFTLLRTDTNETWVGSYNFAPIRNEKGQIVGSVVTGRDITEVKKAQLELIKAKEKAEESDRLKTAFLQNMSHEIRTPMNAIMGFSSLMPKNIDNKEKLINFSNVINQRSADLLEIINDILDISKIESGQLVVSIEDCNLYNLFEEIQSFYEVQQVRFNKNQIHFNMKMDCLTENTIITTDTGKLKQIYINLLNNAFKFTESGSIEGGCLLDENKKLIFYVSDTGMGIAPDKHQFIFERFSQIKTGNPRSYGGTGLGLSIVKGLIHLLGGDIWLESQPGRGTIFYFTIDYDSKNIEFSNTIDKSEQYGDFNFTNKSVLIVEDDRYNTEFIKEVLSETGITIYSAWNGTMAIQMASENHPDIILMDIGLPDMTGYEATLQILKKMPKQKIIAQTAFASSSDKEKATNTGCVGYISKPLKSNDLLLLIAEHLVK